jgi:hypothetical protein
MYKVTYKIDSVESIQVFKWFKTKEQAELFSNTVGTRLIGVVKG